MLDGLCWTDHVLKLAPLPVVGSVGGGGEKLNIYNQPPMEEYSGNYTGPYWSDGKFQESVAFGESDPKSELDALARLHDTAYATYKDRGHREAADEIFNREAKKLVGKFPHLAGDLVLYGNYAQRQATQLAKDVTTPFLGPLLGAAKFAATNVYNANKMLSGTYLKKEKADIEALYARDPRKSAEPPARPPGPSSRDVPKPRVSVSGPSVQEKGRVSTNSVIPLGPSEKNLVVAKQAKHLYEYLKKKQDAEKPLSQHHKQKRKRLNLTKATKILPQHCIQ